MSIACRAKVGSGWPRWWQELLKAESAYLGMCQGYLSIGIDHKCITI